MCEKFLYLIGGSVLFAHRESILLTINIKDLFEFSHKAQSQKELKETLSSLLKEADEERLRLVVKIVKAVVR